MISFGYMISAGLNAQFYMDGQIRVVCLLCREVKEQHFSRNIQKWIAEGQSEFTITDTQIIAMSIDSARNMIRAVDDFITNLAEDEMELRDDENDSQDGEEETFDKDPSQEIIVSDNDLGMAAATK